MIPGRPKKKDGRVVNFYISADVLEQVDLYRGQLSKSQFVERALRFYISHLSNSAGGEIRTPAPNKGTSSQGWRRSPLGYPGPI